MFREGIEMCKYGLQQEEKQAGFKLIQTGKYFLAKTKLLKAGPCIFLENNQEIYFTFERMTLD